MNYTESLSYLYGLGHEVLAAKFGLDSVRLLLGRLGHPQRAFKSVLIAGTNGKGSVAAMLESIISAAGHRTALYTSPHLVRIEERIRVSGDEIPAPEFARLSTLVRLTGEELVNEGRLAAAPTFFEQLTAIAMLHFRDCNPDVAILEVGLGGRLDATNAVEPMVSVVTAIDFDHQNILGDEITQIASEKAAIIKSGCRAVIGRQPHVEASEVLMRRCLEENVLPVFANEPSPSAANDYGRLTIDYESASSVYRRVMLGLRGRHQADNAAAAIEAGELLAEGGLDIPREAIIRGLRQAHWPGRLELIDDKPPMLLDGAHNLGGARSLRAFLEEFCRGPITLVFAAMGDKDIDGMAAELFPIARTLVLTRVRDRRSASTAVLGKFALKTSSNVIFSETVRQALSWARSVTPPEGIVCVAGSLYLVGEVKQLMEREDEQPAG